MERQSSGEERGAGHEPAFSSAAPTGDSYTSQPERDLQPGDPNLVGAAPPEGKKKMTEKVKGLFGGLKKGHHHDDDDTDTAVSSGVGNTPESSPYGTENTGHGLDSNEGGKEDRVPHPQGESNEQGGAALTDHHGNLKPGPHTDSVKRETIFTKIKDILHK